MSDAGDPRGQRRTFSRDERVRSRKDFLAVQKEPGARIRSRSFVLLAREGACATTRLGIVASKKVGGAVERNRAKRLLRESFRRTKADLPAGLDLVVIVGQALPALGLGELLPEWLRAVGELRARASNLRRDLAPPRDRHQAARKPAR
jgi:ribonuclease P protein component